MKKHWDKKALKLKKNDDEEQQTTYRQAGIYSEFGKIICISIGVIVNETKKIRVKSFADHDEKKLLSEFAALVSLKPRNFCGHNINEFDIPYICRRLIINGIKIPPCLNLLGKKPWEIHNIDTMTLWKFGDIKSFTTLDLLATILGVPTSKDDIDGSQVYDVYYKKKNLDRIRTYCEKDVVCTANVLLKMMGESIVDVDK
jgi:predicted PolB exonuclease-like 3'-5' exonuclease